MRRNRGRCRLGQAGSRSLADLRPGEQARVCDVLGNGPIRQRLLDMGLIPSSWVRVERVALAGGPIWLAVRGVQLSLRRAEALRVQVEPC